MTSTTYLSYTLPVCQVLGLSRLRNFLEEEITKSIVLGPGKRIVLKRFKLFHKYGLKKTLAKIMRQKPYFIVDEQLTRRKLDTNLMNSFVSSSLPEPVKYELVKNTIHKFLDFPKVPLMASVNMSEYYSIINFLDLFFYEGKVLDMSPRQRESLEFLGETEDAFHYDTQTTLTKISCDDDCEGRVTLVIEGRSIGVKSFLLTVNSPVFKAMLQSSSFKEGETKRIELPGKSFDEVVYFLSFLNGNIGEVNGKVYLFYTLFNTVTRHTTSF